MTKISDQVLGLDIGSSKLTCVIGEVSSNGRITVLDAREAPSLGWRKGNVTDPELALTSLSELIKLVQFPSAAGVVTRVWVGFSPQFVNTLTRQVAISIERAENRITEDDLRRAFKHLKAQTAGQDQKVLHILPLEYYVDNQLVKEPLGKVGNNLTVKAMSITTGADIVDNLINILQRAGLNVNEVLLSSLVSAEATVNATEKEFGVVYVDMGGQTTGIAYYTHGCLKDLVILPVGSDYITSDLAIGLRTPISCAEKIKIDYGLCPELSTGGTVEVENLTGTEKRQVACRLAVDIIEARANEILSLIRSTISNISHNGIIPSGIIAGGGGALLGGFVELAEKFLGMPVRVRMPEVNLKSGFKLDTVAYSGALGLIKYQELQGNKIYCNSQDIAAAVSAVGLMGKLKTWFHEHF